MTVKRIKAKQTTIKIDQLMKHLTKDRQIRPMTIITKVPQHQLQIRQIQHQNQPHLVQIKELQKLQAILKLQYLIHRHRPHLIKHQRLLLIQKMM